MTTRDQISGDHRLKTLSLLLQDLLLEGRAEPLPLIAPVLFLNGAGTEQIRRLIGDGEGPAFFHESQTCRVERWPIVGAEIAVNSEGSDTHFRGQLSDSRGIFAWTETRLRPTTPDQIANFKGAEFSAARAAATSFEYTTAPLDAPRVAKYLALAHDPNPIHTSDRRARSMGLSGCIVPGLLIAGLAQLAATPAGEPFQTMKARFLAPLPVGDVLTMAVGTLGQDACRVFAVRGDKIIAAIIDFA